MSRSIATLETAPILTEPSRPLSHAKSCDSFDAMGVGHYENFPVASWLMPTHLRPAVRAIYRFARTADDLADEGDATPAERLAALDACAAQLNAIESGAPTDWPDLAAAIASISCNCRLLLRLAVCVFAGRRRRCATTPSKRCSTTAAARPIRSAVCCCSSFAAASRSFCGSPMRSAPACSLPTSGRTSRSTGARAACTCRSRI